MSHIRKLALSTLPTLLVLGGALLGLHFSSARAAQGEQAKSQPQTPPPFEVRQQRQTSVAPDSPAGTLVIAGNTSPITINDNTTASPYPSIATVSGITANTVTQVRVQLVGLTHTFPDDVDVMLEGPQGQRVLLMSDAGGSEDVSGINLTFDSNSSNVLPETSPPALTGGTYRPANYEATADNFPAPGPGATDPLVVPDLRVFNLTNPNGQWKLYVVDDAGTDTGTISGGWLLLLTVPTIFTVNSTADPGDGVCDATECTLREAINAAIANTGNSDLINFSALFNTPQTINLQTALPDISESMTIQGTGAHLLTVRRDFNAATDFRIFTIPAGVTNGVAISGMTITGGRAQDGDSGGIDSDSNLTLTNVHVTGNQGGNGGGANFAYADGVFTNCTFSNNQATFQGGGFQFVGDGGHTLRLVNSTVSGNRSGNVAGGIEHISFSGSSRLEVMNSTIANNFAPNIVGGIETFAIGMGNTATTTLRNTIIANNTPNNLATGTQGNSAATFQTLGFNLSDNFNGVFTPIPNSDITSATPRLGPLSLSGGTTPTHALLHGSPALDAGNASGQTTDQRGAGRGYDTANVPNVSDNSDIGAVEMQSLIVTTAADGGTGSLRNTIANANSNPSLSDIIFDNAVFNTAQTINLLSALPDIAGNTTINGPGAHLLTVRRDPAAADFRIFNIQSGITNGVAISGMTISNGRATAAGNGGFGGGIFSSSNLALTNVHLIGNQAVIGGGVSLFADGVFTGCTFSGNTAGDQGGGINYQGDGHTLRLTNSTVSGNNAAVKVGGILNISFSGNSRLEVVNSTVANNTAPLFGGIATVAVGAGNNATTTLRNTISAGNSPNNLATDPSAGGTMTFTTLGFNLASDNGGGFLNVAPITTDKINTPAGLAPLAANGGTTPTHALLSGSPALDAGNSSGTTSDQRGLRRPIDLPVGNVGDGADIGAFEAQTVPTDVVPTATVTAANVTASGATSYTFTVSYTDDTALNVSTLGTGDVTVTGPNGFSATPTFVSVSPSGNGTPRTATYSFTPPGSSWDIGDNGTYNVAMNANQVLDNNGNAVAAGPLGTFSVTICPTITVNPPTLPNGRAGVAYNQTFTQTGATTPTFSLSAGSLPTGITLTGAVLSGTPTTNGSFNFTIKATDTNGCMGTRAYTLLIQPPCPSITVNPATLVNGFVGTAYSQTLTATGGTAPYTFAVTAGSLPGGLNLASGGALTGTPTATGTFTFTVTATDNAGCTGTRSYTVSISGNGLMFFPLAAPVRLLDTRPGASANACSQPNQPITAQTSRTQPGRNICTIPANAQALTGNVTTVQSGGGFLTLYPSDAAQPTVASTNYGVNEIINNVFTVGLGADGAFKIFAQNTTDVVVDVTGYYAPPGAGGLYFHPLPAPVRLLETRPSQPIGCVKPGVPLTGMADSTQQASSACTGIPAAARAIVGNATTVDPQGNGFLTLFPSDALRPLVASSNYNFGQVVNGPFSVGLATNGEFKIYTHATTHLVVDVLGYYSPEVNDANGTGLLLTPLQHPIRLLETRPGLPVGCFKPGVPLAGGSETPQMARGLCDGVTIPNDALGVVGNATVVFPAAQGFLTLWPSTAARPLVATSNYNAGDVGNRHFIVGLGNADGAFKIYTHATTDLVIDLSGYFAP